MKAASYVRVSTEEQAQHGTSLETQRERTRAYVEEKEWTLVEEFAEEGVSGAKESRPELDRLMAACREGDVEVVVVTKLDRFSRSILHALTAFAELERLGVRVECVDEPNEPGLIRNIKLAIAEDERLRIAERCAAGRLARAREQLWTGGPAPYGYRVENQRLCIDEEEAETIRLAVSLILDEGVPSSEVADILNGLGHRPRMGGTWRPFHLRRVLRTETIAGRFLWGKVGKSEKIEWAIEPIIAPERFDDLQRAFAAVGGAPQGKAKVYPLSGRLTGACGEPYQGAYDNRKDARYYRCRARTFERGRRCTDRGIRADAIEEAVWDEVCALLSHPERLLAMAEEYLELRSTQVEVERDESCTLDKEIRRVERALTDSAVEAMKAGLPAEVIRDATSELTQQLEALQKRRAMIEAWKADSEQQSRRMRKLWELAERAHSRLTDATCIVQKEVLDLLDVRVSILDEHKDSRTRRIKIEGIVANLDRIVENVTL